MRRGRPTNGGKQRKQKDTVIPLTNIDARFRGKLQIMTDDEITEWGCQRIEEPSQGTRISQSSQASSKMCTSMSYWEWKLLHGTAPQPTGWLQKPTFNAWDFDSRDWPWVHFSAEVPLWTQSYWNGELFMIMKSIVLILFYSIFQYWGWCKYWYRESDKKIFQDAKIALFCISMHALLKLFDDLLTNLGVLWALTA